MTGHVTEEQIEDVVCGVAVTIVSHHTPSVSALFDAPYVSLLHMAIVAGGLFALHGRRVVGTVTGTTDLTGHVLVDHHHQISL